MNHYSKQLEANNPYDDAFYAFHDDMAAAPIKEALSIVLGLLPGTKSCIDVGCGIGTWLGVLSQLGIRDVLGVDGPWVPIEHLRIPTTSFLKWDFSRGWPEIKRRYDMAISLEVGEHFQTGLADGFVAFLCSLSDVVVFSAAIPLQGGTNHVNEQWPEYWAEKFRANGYVAVDAFRPGLSGIEGLAAYYKQNMFLATERHLYTAGKLCVCGGFATHILGMVHPEICEKGLVIMRLLGRQPFRAVLRPMYVLAATLYRAMKEKSRIRIL